MQQSHADLHSKAPACISLPGAMRKSSSTCDELRSLTSEVEFASLDLTEPDAAAKLATYVEQLWGGIDILVTNAGAAPQGGFLELKDDDWATGFGLKLFANLRIIKNTWPMLKTARGHQS